MIKPGDKVRYGRYGETVFIVLALTYGENVWVIEKLHNGLVWGGATGGSMGYHTPRLLPASDLSCYRPMI